MSEQQSPSLLTLRQFANKFEGFPVSRLRWLRYRSEPVKRTLRGGAEVGVRELPPNGFAPAFRTVCGRVYIDERKFFEIIDEQNGRNGDGAPAT